MPGLQKIGQIVARNPNLDPLFRAELTRLENSIRDTTPEEVRAEIERQLGKYLRIYQVDIQDVNLAEASVSAVVRFTWLDPVTRRREVGSEASSRCSSPTCSNTSLKRCVSCRD
jgi:ubiquinone biosynthesis protein